MIKWYVDTAYTVTSLKTLLNNIQKNHSIFSVVYNGNNSEFVVVYHALWGLTSTSIRLTSGLPLTGVLDMKIIYMLLGFITFWTLVFNGVATYLDHIPG